MIYLLSWHTVDAGMRYPTTKYVEFDTPEAALAAARALLANKIAVHIEPLEV